MIWIALALIASLIAYFISEKREASDRVGDAIGVLFVFTIIGLFGSLIVSGVWTGETRTHTRIVTSIERGVVNDEAVLMFTTSDGKLWSLPADTPINVGYANNLVIHEPTSPQWLWGWFPSMQVQSKSLTVTP